MAAGSWRPADEPAQSEGRRVLCGLPAAIRTPGRDRGNRQSGAIHAVEGLIWFWALASMAQSLGGWPRRERVRACVEGLTGFVFIGFGVKLVLQRAP
jgi:LysE type translocator